MRVLISANVLGGPGGAQRALDSILRSLEQDEVHIVARRRVATDVAEGVRVDNHLGWRWRGSHSTVGLRSRFARVVLNPVRRLLSRRYDVYIELYQGSPLGKAIRADLRLLVPSGNVVERDRAASVDRVAMQAPDNVRLVPPGAPTVLLTPPVYELSESRSRPDAPVPSEFLLTVFNPYGPIKGADDLARAADASPLPIVWCHSSVTLRFDIDESLMAHPNIVHVENPTPAELRYLYEACHAYLCFSRSEGFGWSIADGLRYSPAVISRSIGLLTDPRVDLSGVHIVGEEWAPDWSVLEQRTDPADRDLSWLEPARFRTALLNLHATRRSR